MNRTLIFSLIAVLNFALVTSIDHLRELVQADSPFHKVVLGSAPNFFAAIAITFLCLGVVAEAEQDGPNRPLVTPLICLSISGIGLCVWEFYQLGSGKLVFDPNDLAATAIGIVISACGILILQRREKVE